MNIMCPECGKPLELVSYDLHNDVGYCCCEKCFLGGIDSDWEVFFTEEGEVEEIRRYYFG